MTPDLLSQQDAQILHPYLQSLYLRAWSIGLADLWESCLSDAQHVLNSRSKSTRKYIDLKWVSCVFWGSDCHCLHQISPCLLHLKLSSILSESPFSTHVSLPCTNGQHNLIYPWLDQEVYDRCSECIATSQGPLLSRDRSLVFTQCTRPPFELVDEAVSTNSSVKTSFIIAVTLARRVNELQVFMVDPQFSVKTKWSSVHILNSCPMW